MRQGTTPTHTFSLPFETSSISKVRITYAQEDKIVLEKTEEDCKLDGATIIVKLSQEETLKFNENAFVKIQAKILSTDGNVLVSNKISLSVGDVLNKEVLI